MHTTTPTISPTAHAASNPRRTAAGVKADRRSPAGPGLDTGEDRRTLNQAGTTPVSDPDHRHNAAVRAQAHLVGPCPGGESFWASRIDAVFGLSNTRRPDNASIANAASASDRLEAPATCTAVYGEHGRLTASSNFHRCIQSEPDSSVTAGCPDVSGIEVSPHVVRRARVLGQVDRIASSKSAMFQGCLSEEAELNPEPGLGPETHVKSYWPGRSASRPACVWAC